jgi:hypothetical protein
MSAQTAVMAEPTQFEVLPERWTRITSNEIRTLESRIAARVLPVSADPAGEPVHLRFGERTLIVLPLDTRRFVQAMARHISLN